MKTSSEFEFAIDIIIDLSIGLIITQDSPKKVSAESTLTWSSYASSVESEVLHDLVGNNRHEVADRLNDLIEMFVKDPKVGRLNFNSFKSVAEFFKQNRNLNPDIVAGWDGFLTVDWRLPPVDPHGDDQTCGGILCLEFCPVAKLNTWALSKQQTTKKVLNMMGSQSITISLTESLPFYRECNG